MSSAGSWPGWARDGSGPIAVAVSLGGAAVLAVIEGASLFRLLAIAAFTYLGLTADRNANLFGLVAGAVLSWNWAEWASALAREGGTARLRPLVSAARVGLGVLLVAWTGLVVSDRFFPVAGYQLHFGLRERPRTYAHEAARFAGGPGLPDRALAYGLQQAGVYLYHNGPDRKVFMDGRLEVPTLATFQTYTGLEGLLNRGDPRWGLAVRDLGDPLILIDHDGHGVAEATILANPGWRCIHFDPMAAVYVPGAGRGLESRYPSVDFEAQHFGLAATRTRPADPGEDYAEARVLLAIGEALVYRVRGGRDGGIGVGLLAQDRALRTLSARPEWPGNWTLLGHVARILPPSGPGRPVGPEEGWDPATGLGPAQSAHAYRRALALDPRNRAALLALGESLEARGISETPDALERLAAGPEGRPWPEAERVASAAMHLGRPDLARKLWDGADAGPSPGLRLARVGDCLFASWEFEDAARSYIRALDVEPDLAVAHVGLAVTRYRQGRAAETREACREGLRRDLDPAQRALLARLASRLR